MVLRKCWKFQCYEREKYIAKVLSPFSWAPKLLYSNDKKKLLVFDYAGEPLTKANAPSNVIDQFNIILNDLKSVNVQHNDIKRQKRINPKRSKDKPTFVPETGELLVLDKKLYLCDFGWASIDNDIGCGIGLWSCKNTDKPGGYLKDSNALKRVGIKPT